MLRSPAPQASPTPKSNASRHNDFTGWTENEVALLRAVDELHDDSRVGDATYAALAAHYDDQQLLDIVFAVGQYHLVSMALNTFGVERDDGVTGVPFPPTR